MGDCVESLADTVVQAILYCSACQNIKHAYRLFLKQAASQLIRFCTRNSMFLQVDF